MGAVTAAALGALTVLGLALIVDGGRRRSRPVASARRRRRGTAEVWGSWSRRRRAWVIASGVCAVGFTLWTGWLIGLVLVPALMLGIPALLSEPPQREIDVLAALDRWVRLLATSISTGKSIRDAIITTRHQVPGGLASEVGALVARLDQGWTTHDALLRMADEVHSADGDAILAALAIAAGRGGTGTRITLSALADNTQDRLRVLRELASERAKPRAVVRQVTLITLAILGGSLLLGGSFFEPYRSPVGQLLAFALAALYFFALFMLRRRTTPAPTPRYLGEPA